MKIKNSTMISAEITASLSETFKAFLKTNEIKETSKQAKFLQQAFYIGALHVVDKCEDATTGATENDSKTSSISPAIYVALLRGEIL